jgi:hypothetical protein
LGLRQLVLWQRLVLLWQHLQLASQRLDLAYCQGLELHLPLELNDDVCDVSYDANESKHDD